MKIFPTQEKQFKLIGNESESLERLSRRTEKSDVLYSRITDRSFIGEVNSNSFRLISSSIGKGAFCVLSGEINQGIGSVRIEIHKVFRYLFGIMLLAPIIGFIALIYFPDNQSPFFNLLICIGQILMIRIVFLGFIFNLLAKESLNRLRDTLDFEWI